MLYSCRNDSVSRIVDECKRRGGNAVICLRFDVGDVGGFAQTSAYGTACVVEKIDDAVQPPPQLPHFGRYSGRWKTWKTLDDMEGLLNVVQRRRRKLQPPRLRSLCDVNFEALGSQLLRPAVVAKKLNNMGATARH
ncbi:hypothetical protein E4U53_007155 [Claviceps sorghi]|nr:hypothetical protein E4U53_007155 [Claviceps sorghi]